MIWDALYMRMYVGKGGANSQDSSGGGVITNITPLYLRLRMGCSD